MGGGWGGTPAANHRLFQKNQLHASPFWFEAGICSEAIRKHVYACLRGLFALRLQRQAGGMQASPLEVPTRCVRGRGLTGPSRGSVTWRPGWYSDSRPAETHVRNANGAWFQKDSFIAFKSRLKCFKGLITMHLNGFLTSMSNTDNLALVS